MLSLLLALACLVIVLVSLIYIKIKITVELIENENQRKLIFEILPEVVKMNKEYDLDKLDLGGSKLWSLLTAVKNKPESGSGTDESPAGHHSPAGLFRFKGAVHNYYRIWKITKRYILIDDLQWKTVVGLEDAMYTALATGSFWALKGSLLSYLNCKKHLKLFKIEVAPDFSTQVIWSHLNCILKVRIGHIILVDIFLLIHRLKNRQTTKNNKTFCYLTAKYAKSAIFHQFKKWGCLNGSPGRETKPSD